MNMNERPTILAVDDFEDNLELIQQVLEDEPLNIITADSGESAKLLVEEHRPDLAILDVHMPDTDGFELCHYQREKFSFNPIPIIFLSAICTTTDHVVHGLNIGACDYIAKPVNGELLRAKVNALLRSESEHEKKCYQAKKVVRRLMKK